jgi:hypothetical protein
VAEHDARDEQRGYPVDIHVAARRINDVSSLLERMERQAELLDGPRAGRREVITDYVAPGWDEIMAVAAHERARWGDINRAIRDGGGPTALAGGLSGLVGGANVPAADLAAVTGGTANVALWDSRLYTPIPALETVPTQFELKATGTVTSSGAGQTVIPNPHIGQSNTVGTNLTACPAAQTLGSTITNAIWIWKAYITLRVPGAGSAATAIGYFEFLYTVLAAGGAPTQIIWRSTANATFDSTALNGFVPGVTPSAAGVSITPQQIQWVSIG